LLNATIFAQDLEYEFKKTKTALKENPISVNGSIGANAVFYKANGIQARRDPFYYVFNANLNFTLFDKISVPFSAVITQQDKNFSNGIDKFSQPFNQFGISPKYKWLTVHAGYRALDYSEYTLAGALFLGGAIEIKPEKYLLNGSAFYGRFSKAIPKGGVDGVVVTVPAYERLGGGTKLRLGNDINCAEVIVMKIRDDIHSIAIDSSMSQTPQENDVISIGGKKQIAKIVSFSADMAFSMLTKNLYEEEIRLPRFSYANQFYSPRPSSQFNKALNAALEMRPGKMQVGIRYKRIDPDYRTLGAVFLTNDVEEISTNSAFSLLKSKINVNASAGLQRNNLDQIQTMTSRRLIGSCNFVYAVNSKLNLNLNYSNFSSNTIPMRDAFTDTIRFVQLTQNGGFNTTYSFGKKNIQHTVSNSITYQESGGNQIFSSTFLNEVFSYNFNFTKQSLSINLSSIYNSIAYSGNNSHAGFGPSLGIQKGIFKNKMRLSLNAGFQDTYQNNQNINKNITASFSIQFTIDKHQSLQADLGYLERKAIQVGSSSFSESRGSIAYRYNFIVKKKIKPENKL